MRGIDFFAGKGGYTSAMRAAGIEVVGACESDELRRSDYIALHGHPEWFGRDAESAYPPVAELWTACAAVPLLLDWVEHRRAAAPEWTLIETVTTDIRVLFDLWWPTFCRTIARAGARSFLILGPTNPRLPKLPAHDGRGPESDPVALALVLRAILEADE